jgi:hypothetical protein
MNSIYLLNLIRPGFSLKDEFDMLSTNIHYEVQTFNIA